MQRGGAQGGVCYFEVFFLFRAGPLPLLNKKQLTTPMLIDDFNSLSLKTHRFFKNPKPPLLPHNFCTIYLVLAGGGLQGGGYYFSGAYYYEVDVIRKMARVGPKPMFQKKHIRSRSV